MEKEVSMTSEKRFPKQSVTTTAWNEVTRSGAYVCNETGRLVRFPPSALKEGHSPVVELVGPAGSESVTFLSENPYCPIEKLRILCANADIEPNF